MRRGNEIKFNDGPQAFSRHYVEPKDGMSQLFHLHLEEYGPGGRSQKHGHVNEAAFYILDGDGVISFGRSHQAGAGDCVEFYCEYAPSLLRAALHEAAVADTQRADVP